MNLDDLKKQYFEGVVFVGVADKKTVINVAYKNKKMQNDFLTNSLKKIAVFFCAFFSAFFLAVSS